MSDPIADLLAAARRVAETPDGPRRDALWLRYSRLMAPIYDQREALLKRLSVGYDRLNDTTPDADPKYAAKEEAWLSWEIQYRTLTDALNEAASHVRAHRPPTSDSMPLPFPLPLPTP